MKAKLLAATVLALWAGLLIGRMAPQADLRRVKAELESAKAPPAQRSSSEAAVQGVRSILKVSDQDMDKARRIRRARERMSNDVAQAELPSSGAETNAPVSGVRTQSWADAATMSNNIASLKKGWEVRTQLARNNLIKKANLDESSTLQFDVLIEAMNLRLGATVDTWAMRLRDQDALTEESGIRMMNELSQAMVLTYDELDRKLPRGWRERAGAKFELVQFVDPEVLTPLQELDHLPQRQSDEGE